MHCDMNAPSLMHMIQAKANSSNNTWSISFSVVLQNKLHRNAGPEDLVATEAMLKRISNGGDYNQDFVSEFRRFTAELRDFFNAGSFADMLDGLKAALDDQEKQVVADTLLPPPPPPPLAVLGLQASLEKLQTLKKHLHFALLTNTNTTILNLQTLIDLCTVLIWYKLGWRWILSFTSTMKEACYCFIVWFLSACNWGI